MRRGLVTAVLLCALGAGLVIVATAQTWLALRFPGVLPLPERRVDIRGTVLVPGARALAFVGLAGVAALPAARGRGRQLVGAVVAVAGAGAAAVVVRALGDPGGALAAARTGTGFAGSGRLGFGGWPYVALVGALMLLAAGALAVARGRTWPALGARYEPPTAGTDATPPEPSLWDALDRGDDPTT